MSADTFALYEFEFHKTKHKLKNMQLIMVYFVYFLKNIFFFNYDREEI